MPVEQGCVCGGLFCQVRTGPAAAAVVVKACVRFVLLVSCATCEFTHLALAGNTRNNSSSESSIQLMRKATASTSLLHSSASDVMLEASCSHCRSCCCCCKRLLLLAVHRLRCCATLHCWRASLLQFSRTKM
jgi:hypothetical protein